MKLKELKAKIDKWYQFKGADELEVLVKVEDVELFPVVPNPDKDDNYYSIRDIYISLLKKD